MSLDIYGRCVVCGHRDAEGCCVACHDAHDAAWQQPTWAIGPGQRLVEGVYVPKYQPGVLR